MTERYTLKNSGLDLNMKMLKVLNQSISYSSKILNGWVNDVSTN
jgi:hypothetical protein